MLFGKVNCATVMLMLQVMLLVEITGKKYNDNDTSQVMFRLEPKLILAIQDGLLTFVSIMK